jgi:two-component system, oxyanion-binding sensor
MTQERLIISSMNNASRADWRGIIKFGSSMRPDYFTIQSRSNPVAGTTDAERPDMKVFNPVAMSRLADPRKVHIGFVPLTDCAPLIAAVELGLFEKRGLRVSLHREPGWASVREKMLHGELDAAHAPASMVFELSLGLGVPPVSTLTGMVMGHHGNAIMISNELWASGVRTASDLGGFLRKQGPHRRLTFAGVLRYSSQNYLMRKWLRKGGVDPDRDVSMVVVPPPLVVECMEQGHIDGYCVAEPWASSGILRGVGECVTLSSELDPGHPEKVFMVSSRFAEERHETHLQILATLIEAAAWCDHAPNRPGLAVMLAEPRYLGVSVNSLRNALVGPFVYGEGRVSEATDAIRFSQGGINRPTPSKAAWVAEEIRSNHLFDPGLVWSEDIPERLFREDLYEQAYALTGEAASPRSSLVSFDPLASMTPAFSSIN